MIVLKGEKQTEKHREAQTIIKHECQRDCGIMYKEKQLVFELKKATITLSSFF